MRFKYSLIVVFVFFINIINASLVEEMDHTPIFSNERYELTKEYARVHYNLDRAFMVNPKIIVIHHTAIATMGQTIAAFMPNKIPQFRGKLAAYGDVNVSTHYVVDRFGKINCLMPTTLMGRHTIGFNYTSIGIENVALDSSRLTDEQIQANAQLVEFLMFRHPSIEYLIGHHEYMNQTLPHFKYYKAEEKSYEPTIKIDPGFTFMNRLRNHLRRDFGISLKD